jgi:general secretion pathway protein L
MKMERASLSRVAEWAQWPSRLEPALRTASRWWFGELASLMPAAVRRRFASLHSRFVLVVEGTGLSLFRETNGERVFLTRGDPRTPQAIQRAFAAMPSGGKDSRRDVILRLPADRALRMRAALPLAAERNLAQVVGFEFERLVPFRRDDAYYAHRVLARDKAARSLQIELTVVPRADIDALTQAVGKAAIQVTALEIAGAEPADTPSVIVLDRSESGTAPSYARLAVIVLATLTVVLAAGAIAIPFLHAESRLDRLTVELAAARRDADLSTHLQTAIDARIQDQHFLIDRRLRFPTVTELLDTVTRLAPDDTWLTEFQVTGGELRVTGVATSATALLGLIDQSPSFHNAAFRSPVVQDTKQGKERFDIAAEIVPRGAK